MVQVDFKKLKELRDETGVSLSLCKKALEQSQNDLKKAREKLKEWGADRAKEKEQRETMQGGIFSYTHHNRKIAALVELQCETDFVSGNDEFQTLGKELAMQIASTNPEDTNKLLGDEYVRDPSKTVKDLLKEAVLKFGENIKIARFMRWQLGE